MKSLKQLNLNVSVNKITDNGFIRLENEIIENKIKVEVDKIEIMVFDISINHLTSYEKSKSIKVFSTLLVQMKSL